MEAWRNSLLTLYNHMIRCKKMKNTTSVFFIIAGYFGMFLAVAADNLPETSHDGLVLQKDSELAAVYIKPGADFSGYDKLAVLDCYVAFKKNWQRDQNENNVSVAQTVTKKDMDEIKTHLATEFKKVFVEELQTEGGYEVVDHGAEDVMIIRPAIIDLDIEAPDTMTPGMSATFSASAGQMTLYMELFDSVTSEIIARVVDAEGGRDHGMIRNRATNKAEADRILRKWADILRSHLDRVHGKK
jgi:hypothetical protein